MAVATGPVERSWGLIVTRWTRCICVLVMLAGCSRQDRSGPVERRLLSTYLASISAKVEVKIYGPREHKTSALATIPLEFGRDGCPVGGVEFHLPAGMQRQPGTGSADECALALNGSGNYDGEFEGALCTLMTYVLGEPGDKARLLSVDAYCGPPKD